MDGCVSFGGWSGMRTVYLHGILAEQFGPKFRLDVKSPAEAVRALTANFRGRFLKIMNENRFVIREGTVREIPLSCLHMEGRRDIHFIPVMEGAGGGRKGGLGMILMGAAIVAAAVFTAGAAAAAAASAQATATTAAAGGVVAGSTAAATGIGSGLGMTAFSIGSYAVSYGSVAMFGASMVLSGVASALTPTPKLNQGNYGNRERPDERPSFIFGGPVNVSEQGGPIPIVVGEVMAGSIVASAGISTERLPV